MKKIILLGATGTIGEKTLALVREFPEVFEIVALSAHSNHEALLTFHQEFPNANFFLTSENFDELLEFVTTEDFDLLVLAGLGAEIGKMAEIALARNKSVAIATKEILVPEEGKTLVALAEKGNGKILPIDSEISAVWQCLHGEEEKNIRRVFLTASGGPFRDAKKFPKSIFPEITPEMAVAHPRWKMGAKISVDSATLANKAYELIEIARLFRVAPKKIEVVIHPEAEIHSAVEFCDGSIKAQISPPEMKIPIARALFFPDIPPKLSVAPFSFFEQKWEFSAVDETRFPTINFARRALREEKCSEFLQANDAAVADFLAGKIRFDEIFSQIEAVFSSKSL